MFKTIFEGYKKLFIGFEKNISGIQKIHSIILNNLENWKKNIQKGFKKCLCVHFFTPLNRLLQISRNLIKI
jgi:hypothetical protein